MSDEHRTDCTADGRVEDEDDEVSLIVEADAGGREVAVVIVLQYAAVTDLAVMTARRCRHQTHRTRLKLRQLLLLLLLMLLTVIVAFTRPQHDAASVKSTPYSLAGRLRQSLQ